MQFTNLVTGLALAAALPISKVDLVGKKLNLVTCSYDSGRTCALVDAREVALPPKTRFMDEGDAYTMDFVEERFNGAMDGEGVVVRTWWG